MGALFMAHDVPPIGVKAHGGEARTGIRWSASPVMTNGRESRDGRALLPAYHIWAALDEAIRRKFNANQVVKVLSGVGRDLNSYCFPLGFAVY